MEKAPWAKEHRQPLEASKSKERLLPSSLQKENNPSQHLGFSPVRLILNLWPPGISGNTSVLFEAARFGLICYNSNWTVIHGSRLHPAQETRNCHLCQQQKPLTSARIWLVQQTLPAIPWDPAGSVVTARVCSSRAYFQEVVFTSCCLCLHKVGQRGESFLCWFRVLALIFAWHVVRGQNPAAIDMISHIWSYLKKSRVTLGKSTRDDRFCNFYVILSEFCTWEHWCVLLLQQISLLQINSNFNREVMIKAFEIQT